MQVEVSNNGVKWAESEYNEVDLGNGVNSITLANLPYEHVRVANASYTERLQINNRSFTG